MTNIDIFYTIDSNIDIYTYSKGIIEESYKYQVTVAIKFY